jgi:putative phosphotransacetylase
MTPEQIAELAQRIVRLLDAQGLVHSADGPEPSEPRHAGNLPAWSGAALDLSDVAPGGSSASPGGRHRPVYHALVAATRGAAAGRAPSPTTGTSERETESTRSVPIAVSNRHIHLSQQHVHALFGHGFELTPDRTINQPGQFAANERLTVSGPTGEIEGVRVVGPARKETQVELALSDCHALGTVGVVSGSGNLAEASAIELKGPAGSVKLDSAMIVPARHLHLCTEDATHFGLKDGDRVDLTVGSGDRSATLHKVLVRSGPNHATEFHLDVDEARAFAIGPDCRAQLHKIGRESEKLAKPAPGRLVTERDVAWFAGQGKTLSDSSPYLLTPAAKDRAKALGIWKE